MTTTAGHAATGTQVGFTLDSWGDVALVLVPTVLVAVLALLLVARLVRPRTGSWAERLRIDLAVLRYDLWLDLSGVRRRRRRELRQELRANLTDSAARLGARDAVRRLGPLRRLAAESAEATQPVARPRWAPAGVAAVYAFAAVLVLELLAAMWWASAADASGVQTVRGSLALFPASAIEYSTAGGGTSLEFRPGWLVLAAAATTFLVVSRPWLLRRSGRRPSPASTAAR